MTGELLKKFAILQERIGEMRSVVVAYSGGVDSALVLAVAQEQLQEGVLACIGVSASYPRRELRDAVAFAESLGARYRLIETSEQDDPRYRDNRGDRCYFCKVDLYRHLQELARREGFGTIANGVNADDLEHHVHGMGAARQWGIRSPLLEAGCGKEDVRQIARALGLSIWDKPAMACLSSRVPPGTPITESLLRQIERAEDVLAGLGFRQFRVRHHGEVARIEVSTEELCRAIERRQEIIRGIRDAGYQFITLDLVGFRSGSTSEALIALNIPASAAPPAPRRT